MDRREFARASALTAVAALTGPAAAAPRPDGRRPATPANGVAQQAQAPSAEARALGEWLRTRYGDRLTANEFADVVRDIDGAVRRAARLNAPALANADEPDFVFRAYRGAD